MSSQDENNAGRLIFLSYSRGDKEKVDNLYRQLREAELNPWMDQPPFPFDKLGIPPGADWDTTIREKLRTADWALICISKNSIDKEGYFQREIRLALDRMNNMPPGKNYLIPVLLEECTPQEIRIDTINLNSRQWYKLYQAGFEGLADLISRETSTSAPKNQNNAIIPLADELLTEEQNFSMLNDRFVRSKGEWQRTMDSINSLSPHIDKAFVALARAKERSFNLRDSRVIVDFELAAKSYRDFAASLKDKLLELRQVSNAMSEYFNRGLVAASDWYLVTPEFFQSKLKDILENRRGLTEILPKAYDLRDNIMKSMRGTTKFNAARRLAAESIGTFGREIEREIKLTEEQEGAIIKILGYFPDS